MRNPSQGFSGHQDPVKTAWLRPHTRQISIRTGSGPSFCRGALLSPPLSSLLPLKTHCTKSSISKVWPVDDRPLTVPVQIPGCLTRPAESPILILGCKNMHFKEDFQVILLHTKMCELLHEGGSDRYVSSSSCI